MLLIKAHHALPKLRAEAYCAAGLLGCDAIGSRDATLLNAAFPLQIYIKTRIYKSVGIKNSCHSPNWAVLR